MEVYETISDDSYWYGEVVLNEKEWPELDNKNFDLFDRPIRKWVCENFPSSDFFFFSEGKIYFRYEEDILAFVLRWL